MSFTETTSSGWFGRIGSSITGVLFGLVLLVVSLVMLVWNERNAVQDLKTNREIAEIVISVSADAVDSANEGKLVHLNGRAKTDDLVTNQQFAIEENAIRLSWDVQIYQWVEKKESKKRKKLGGGEETVTTYTYKKEWVNKPIDSSRFKESGHDNGSGRKYGSGSSQAKDVTLGAFKLSDGLISQMLWNESYLLQELPDDWKDEGRLSGGVFYTGTPGSPKIRDEKVSFSLTGPDDVSVMAVQTGDSFSTYKSETGKTKLLLYQGLLSAEEVVKGEETKAKLLRWALRGGGIVVMFIGFLLFLKPLSVLADVLPFLGNFVGGVSALVAFLLSIAISAMIIAMSWIFFRPVLGIGLFVVVIACLFLIKRKMSSKNQIPASVPPPLN